MCVDSYRLRFINIVRLNVSGMLTQKEHKPSGKIWIEYKGKPILGKGGAEIPAETALEHGLLQERHGMKTPNGIVR